MRGEKLTILGAVPKKYDGKRRVPLVISLHGGGSDTHKNLPEATRAAEGEIRYWSKGCEDVGAILLAPTTTDEYWAVDRGREIIMGALRYACDGDRARSRPYPGRHHQRLAAVLQTHVLTKNP